MGLNKASGNMYEFVTYTWNAIKGECPHGCSYCYMHRWGKQKPVHFDEKELKTDLGSGNFIFVGSSCDMFANEIKREWIKKTIERCNQYNNKYLFQTKNPERMSHWISTNWILQKPFEICVTVESNRFYNSIMRQSPCPKERITVLNSFFENHFKMITIEPILDFDLNNFVDMLKIANPEQVNIGADSGNNHLPEPSGDKVFALIDELSKFTKVVQKPNLGRLLNNAS